MWTFKVSVNGNPCFDWQAPKGLVDHCEAERLMRRQLGHDAVIYGQDFDSSDNGRSGGWW
jgi:hypothetical protein